MRQRLPKPSTIMVDGGRTLKRMRPAPQGRGYRVRKRSNHVTVIVDTKGTKLEVAPVVVEETVAEEKKEVAKAAPKKKTK